MEEAVGVAVTSDNKTVSDPIDVMARIHRGMRDMHSLFVGDRDSQGNTVLEVLVEEAQGVWGS